MHGATVGLYIYEKGECSVNYTDFRAMWLVRQCAAVMERSMPLFTTGLDHGFLLSTLGNGSQ